MNWIDLSGMKKPTALPADWEFVSRESHMNDEDIARCGDTLLVTMGSHEIGDTDVVAVQDHLNLSGKNPLRGHNNDTYGVRFPDMSHPYAIPKDFHGKKVIVRSGQHEESPVDAIDAEEVVYQTILAKHQLKKVYALIYGKNVIPDDIVKIMTGE